MRRSGFVLVVIMCLLLTGCRVLPTPREMGDMALLRTVGIDPAQRGVSMTVSTGPQAKGTQGERQPALCLSVEGESLSGAALAAQGESDKYVFFGYVDQLILGEEQVQKGVDPVLNWFATDEELSLGARLWIIRGDTARAAVESGGEEGVDARLSNFQRDAAVGAAPISRTAEEVAIALNELGCAYVSALTLEGETPALRADGYAVLSGDGLAGYLDGEAARGLELLAEKPMADVLELKYSEGAAAVRVTSAQIDCEPVFDEDGLKRLDLTCRVETEIAQQEGELSREEREEVQRLTQIQLERRLRTALRQLQEWETDCTALSSRVALAAPWYERTMRKDWPGQFSQVEVRTQVKVTLGIGRG